MNILYLHTSVISDYDVAETLRGERCRLVEAKAPEQNGDEAYATALMTLIEEQEIELVLSLRYIPLVSIVCNAMQKKYAAWVCCSYEPMLYSCTLLNSCNYIFLADYSQYEEFAGYDTSHIFYLPLAANVERIERVLKAVKMDIAGSDAGAEVSGTVVAATEREEKVGNLPDICMMQDIYTRDAMPFHPLSVGSPLKDSTKGYLEGCIACQHQVSGLPSMSAHLPAYVMEDLKVHFTPRVGGDSVETASHYYDYTYFNELITYADRDIHLNVWARNPHAKRVDLYNACSEYTSEKVHCHKRLDYLKQLPVVATQSKINYVVTHRNWKSGIPQISWDIMAAGGCLLSNVQMDYFRVFKDTFPILYADEREMLSKGIYYIHHEAERKELTERLKAEVSEKHNLGMRIQEILKKV